jgi:hypothetical protein
MKLSSELLKNLSSDKLGRDKISWTVDPINLIILPSIFNVIFRPILAIKF